MKGILLLAHGSRQKDTEKAFEIIAAKVRANTGIDEVETAYLQFSERDMKQGFDELLKRGCDDILVIPYFLFEGNHIRQDIPEGIEAYCADHPRIAVRLGGVLGTDDRLAQIVAEQVSRFCEE